MKQEFGKVKSQMQDFTCTVYNFQKYIELVKAEECPEGFMPIMKVLPKPEPKPSEILWFRYRIENGTLVKEYFCRPAPRIISKFKLYMTLQPLGLYEMLEDFLKETTTPEGINAFKAYEIANELSEENPIFFNMLSQVSEALGVDKEQTEEILNNCIAE